MLIAAKCPNCGADIKLDDARETGFCMYCGTTIIIREALQTVKIDNSHMIQNWMNMGLSAYQAGNNQEAYSYFVKVVENDPNNWQAIFYKGISASWQSTMANPRIIEAIQGTTKAKELLTKSDMTQEEKDANIGIFSIELYKNLKAYFDLWFKFYMDLENPYDAKRAIDFVFEMKNCFKYAEFTFDLIENISFDNPDLETFKFEMRKFIAASLCYFICESYEYWSDYKQTTLLYWGLSVKDKQEYITVHDKMMVEILKVKPNFKSDIWRDEPGPRYKPTTTSMKAGCYIATAVYGSYDAPEVLTLKNFRDDVLTKSILGRLFVKLYYFFSPPIANKLKYANRINKIVKNLLNRIVMKINNKNSD